VPACPFGVIGREERTGGAAKCTLCYDRLKAGRQPACAQACPTESILFGPLSEMRSRASARLAVLHQRGDARARLYGEDPDDGIGGAGAMFLLRDEPEVYGLPPRPVATTRDLPMMWASAAGAAAALVVGISAIVLGSRR
jgi:formate dehydrogenase iron-sulfur subunit